MEALYRPCRCPRVARLFAMPGRCRPGLCGLDLGSAVTASFHVGSATQPERASPCRRPDRPRQWNTAEPRCGRALPCGCAATVLWSWRSETVPCGANLAALRLTAVAGRAGTRA